MADEENKDQAAAEGQEPEAPKAEAPAQAAAPSAVEAAAQERKEQVQAAAGTGEPPAPGTVRPADAVKPTAYTIKTTNPAKALEMAKDKVYVWPYLVRIEFLAGILVTALLLGWSLIVDAPLEEPANPARTPNPSKAPWYFLGLQEMLVYFDPWMAGVILPQFIITGLMVLPYIDVNPKGNGYYTYRERKFAINSFLFGFLVLWIMLIEVGVFMRGPGWNFFAPWDYWDPHLVKALTNVDLVDWWIFAKISPYMKIGGVDILGGIVTGVLVMGLPVLGWIMASDAGKKIPLLNKVFGPTYRETVEKMGATRYWVTAIHYSLMLFLPVKMVLRWFFNLKYLWVTPWFKI